MIFEQGKIYYYNGSEWGEIGSSATDVDVFTIVSNSSAYATDVSGVSSQVKVPNVSHDQILAAVTAFKAGKMVMLKWINDEDTYIEYYMCQLFMSNDTESENNEIHLQINSFEFLSTPNAMLRVTYETSEAIDSVNVYYYPPVSPDLISDFALLTTQQTLSAEQKQTVLNNLGLVNAANQQY